MRKDVIPILDKKNDKMYIIDQHNISPGDPRFIFTIDTTKGTGSSFTLPLRSGFTYNFTVDWGDNTTSEITAYNDSDITHTYSSGGVYQVSILGTCQSFYFNNVGDKLKLTAINNIGNVAAITMAGAFYGCTNLTGSINADWFKYNTLIAVSGFQNTFRGCSGLTGSIPADLFRYNTLVSSNGFNSTFLGCSGLTGSIPADLFRYNTAVTTNGFNATFNGCSGLTGSIPSDLFRYNTAVSTNAFLNLFINCTGLTGSIPADLFRYNTAASSGCYSGTFRGCSGLTGSIPSDLFRYGNTNSFIQTFFGCIGLTSIPEDLFYYNSSVTTYEGAFQGCRNLVLPTRLFNLSNLSIVTTFANFMDVTSTTYSPTGTIQDIWNYTTATSTDAFDQCTAITNYADIPTAWK